ncbi:MAG: trehalose-phosphatase [Candidatus Aquicultorales bacterium]
MKRGAEAVREALKPLKAEPGDSAVFSDIDGTVSRIAAKPQDAVVGSDVKQVLLSLEERFRLVCLVTGRDVETAVRMVGTGRLCFIGSHGLETLLDGRLEYAPEAGKYLRLIPQLAERLRRVLGNGILVEEKRLAIGLHYRGADDPQKERERVLEAVAPIVKSTGLVWMQAKSAIELRPGIPLDKGDAVAALVERLGPKRLAYFGDDVTDIAAFRALERAASEGKYAVKAAVGSGEAPEELIERADVVLEDVDRVIETFTWLAGE